MGGHKRKTLTPQAKARQAKVVDQYRTTCPKHGKDLIPTRNGTPRLCCPLYECDFWRNA